jgi:hypothetical protein
MADRKNEDRQRDERSRPEDQKRELEELAQRERGAPSNPEDAGVGPSGYVTTDPTDPADPSEVDEAPERELRDVEDAYEKWHGSEGDGSADYTTGRRDDER